MNILKAEPQNEETPIDRLLREQARLETPVVAYAREHERGTVEDRYESLIPLGNPQRGEQLAFEVDLDRCSGCKACVTACHSLNGLDENETWRDVGLLQGQTETAHYQQTVTTACHHCVEPGCLEGCPVNAYEKDPLTGIVLHLDDQCIGCQYCVLKCPYDVPKYNERLGIVRKCDMCHNRLSQGEPPACVQACPTEAIRIRIVSQSETTAAARTEEAPAFLPDSPHQNYTVPTTAYVSRRGLPQEAKAADSLILRPQHAHWPLVWMLALTQISVGLATATAAVPSPSWFLSGAAVAIGFAGLGASVLHLGRPLQAWRAFMGLGHSWLSREIFAFGGFAPLLVLSLGLQLLDLPFTRLAWTVTALAGLGAIYTSVMIYHDTRRRFWRFPRTFVRFYGTAGTLAGAGLILSGIFSWGAPILLASSALKLLAEGRVLRQSSNGRNDADNHSARIQTECKRSALRIRWGASIVGTLILVATPVAGVPFGLLGIVLLSAAEIAERYLFFTAVYAPKMPGGVSA